EFAVRGGEPGRDLTDDLGIECAVHRGLRRVVGSQAGENSRAGGRRPHGMPQQGLVTSRAVVQRNYAILPPEGIPESVLPEWSATAARILTAPAMGAAFAHYLLDLAKGGGTKQALSDGIEAFVFVLEGRAKLELAGRAHDLAQGGYAYLSPG